MKLSHSVYGKHRVRVSKKRQHSDQPGRHEFVEATVNVELEGDFDAAYTDADNRSLVATDTCKNTVYAVAKDDDLASIETFAVRLAEHFLSQYDHVHRATIWATENCWTRLLDCDHAFTADQRHRPVCTAVADRGGDTILHSGIEELMIAKTTQSGFENFHRDEYRTLADTKDRILATSLTAIWRYDGVPANPVAVRQTVTDAMMRSFIDHYSHSIQETLMRMGTAAIESNQNIASIRMTMPNKHHILFAMDDLGRKNDNEVFAVTDEPFGYIEATVQRD